MKEKYLVCEIHYGKLLGGSIYNTEEDAQHAFCTTVEDYGIFADNESVENGLFETEDGYVIQMTKVLDNE